MRIIFTVFLFGSLTLVGCQEDFVDGISTGEKIPGDYQEEEKVENNQNDKKEEQPNRKISEQKIMSTHLKKEEEVPDKKIITNEKGNTTDGDIEIIREEELNSILILVNKERALPSDYVPLDLVKPNVPFPFEEELPQQLMRKEAAQALEELFEKASKENLNLFAQSGYRSYNRQDSIFAFYVEKQGLEQASQLSAQAGHSEHQTGLAMDVTSPSVNLELIESFENTEEGTWIKENAHLFGFIIRYPKGKEKITGYHYEPWHIRYVGKKAAKEIYLNGYTLEQYLGFK